MSRRGSKKANCGMEDPGLMYRRLDRSPFRRVFFFGSSVEVNILPLLGDHIHCVCMETRASSWWRGKSGMDRIKCCGRCRSDMVTYSGRNCISRNLVA